MDQSLFYKCSFFEHPVDKERTDFSLIQKEIVMDQVFSDGKVSFVVKDIEYVCSFRKQEHFDSKKPTILIPIKDNSKLLEYTIKNLQETNVVKHCNILVIDDRSEENIKKVANRYGTSYLRIDNDKGFNFSMLNNIAVKICHDLGNNTVILWNSDLWCVKEDFFLELLKRHNESKSKISGTKLIYPPQEVSLNKEIDTKNIEQHFPQLMNGKWRKTVQFGGDRWVPIKRGEQVVISPDHYKRFSDKSNPLVNCDRGCLFVTGALQIWDIKYFMELGGLNPSLAKNFQDVDMCLKSVDKDIIPLYFGKDIYFYHDESLNMHNIKGEKKNDSQLISDQYLFNKIWDLKKLIDLVY